MLSNWKLVVVVIIIGIVVSVIIWTFRSYFIFGLGVFVSGFLLGTLSKRNEE